MKWNKWKWVINSKLLDRFQVKFKWFAIIKRMTLPGKMYVMLVRRGSWCDVWEGGIWRQLQASCVRFKVFWVVVVWTLHYVYSQAITSINCIINPRIPVIKRSSVCSCPSSSSSPITSSSCPTTSPPTSGIDCHRGYEDESILGGVGTIARVCSTHHTPPEELPWEISGKLERTSPVCFVNHFWTVHLVHNGSRELCFIRECTHLSTHA